MIIPKRLIKKALITSPLIALYGVSPVFLFIETPMQEAIISFAGLTIGILLFWMVNFLLAKKDISAKTRYALSYGITLVMHAISTIFTLRFIHDDKAAERFIYSVIATLAVNTIILVIIDTELTRQQKVQAEAENRQLKITNLEAQKKALNQQIQPHFLFNALSILKSLIREDQSEAEAYTLRLSDFLRYTTQTTLKDLVVLQEEINFTRDYLILQQTRFGSALSFEIEIPESWMKYKIPVFALQGLAENAIKHNKISETNQLKIIVMTENEKIRVQNNKSTKPLKVQPGVGLQNLNERYLLTLKQPITIIESGDHFTVLLDVLQE